MRVNARTTATTATTNYHENGVGGDPSIRLVGVLRRPLIREN